MDHGSIPAATGDHGRELRAVTNCGRQVPSPVIRPMSNGETLEAVPPTSKADSDLGERSNRPRPTICTRP